MFRFFHIHAQSARSQAKTRPTLFATLRLRIRRSLSSQRWRPQTLDPRDIGRRKKMEKEWKRKGRPLKTESWRRKGQMLWRPTTEMKTLDLAPNAKIVEVDGDVADSWGRTQRSGSMSRAADCCIWSCSTAKYFPFVFVFCRLYLAAAGQASLAASLASHSLLPPPCCWPADFTSDSEKLFDRPEIVGGLPGMEMVDKLSNMLYKHLWAILFSLRSVYC